MPSRITVMTYNVRYDNPNDGEYVWHRRRDEVASVVRFHHPDLVGLQEASPDQLEDMRDRLPEFEWLVAGRPSVENAGEYPAIGYDRARFNLESDDTFWLSETPDVPGSLGWDAMLPRLVKYVRLRERDTGVQLYHFNTHFDHAGETARLESAHLLRDRIDDVAVDLPLVLTGDFNSRQGSPPYRYLTERDKSSPGRTLVDTHRVTQQRHHGPGTTMTDFRNLIPDKKIDYVFVTDDVEVVGHGVCADSFDNGIFPSDHLPVRVELLFPEST
ncbi:MAG: endonuclease/exonuclease/phosphatase family protein [Salinigranum sp.]